MKKAVHKSLWLWILLLGLVAWGCQREPIRLGLAVVLTGPYADLGIHARNGARLAVEEINRRGGVDGRALKLFVQNDEGTVEGAKKARELLVHQGVSVIIGHMLSTQCLEALSELPRLGVPLVSPVASSPLLSGKKDLFFRLRPDGTAPAVHLAKHLISRGLLKAGILYDTKNPGYTEPWAVAFAQAMESFGGSILFNTGFSSLDDGADISLVETVIEKDPDALLLVSSAQETARLVVSLVRLKVTFPLFGVGWAQTDRLITEAGKAARYLVLATNDPPVEEAPGAAEFVRFYKKRFGTVPSFAAVRAYDTVRFLVQALETVAGRPERLSEALGQPREFDSLLGRFGMDPYGDVHAESYLVSVREDRFVKFDGR